MQLSRRAASARSRTPAAAAARRFGAAAGPAAGSARTLNQPRGGNEMPRAGGPNTFMRLPSADLYDNPHACEDLDVAVVGIPLDTGTSFRTGCRFGPRQIRQESAMLRPYNSTPLAPNLPLI